MTRESGHRRTLCLNDGHADRRDADDAGFIERDAAGENSDGRALVFVCQPWLLRDTRDAVRKTLSACRAKTTGDAHMNVWTPGHDCFGDRPGELRAVSAAERNQHHLRAGGLATTSDAAQAGIDECVVDASQVHGTRRDRPVDRAVRVTRRNPEIVNARGGYVQRPRFAEELD